MHDHCVSICLHKLRKLKFQAARRVASLLHQPRPHRSLHGDNYERRSHHLRFTANCLRIPTSWRIYDLLVWTSSNWRSSTAPKASRSGFSVMLTVYQSPWISMVAGKFWRVTIQEFFRLTVMLCPMLAICLNHRQRSYIEGLLVSYHPVCQWLWDIQFHFSGESIR